jgi:hypothetical protein
MDYALYGSSNAYTLSNKIASWIITKSGGNPANIKDGYKLNGTVSGTDPEAVFVAPFVAASVVNSNNQAFLNSGWTFLKTKKSGYYSDTYSLLCQLFISGNWWKPEAGVVTPTCTPASASSDDGNVATNVLDNDLTTRWSASGDGQYIQFCLGTATAVNGLDIAFYSGDTRKASFDILTSTDGTAWTTTASGLQSSGTTTALETFSFATTTAKYVRILGHGNNINAWNSITEVKIKTVSNTVQTTLTAVKDAYVRNGTYADSAYGTSDPLLLSTKLNTAATPGYDRQTYLGFDLSSISGTISSVVLKVYGKLEDLRTTNIPVGVYSVSNTTWTETALTWNNKPATAATTLSTVTLTDSLPRYYNWDITAYVKSEKAAGRNAISLALINLAISTPRLVWNSKETGNNAPQLVVTTIPAAAKTASNEKISTQQLSVYPTPFNNNANIAFTLKDAGLTTLAVYDVNGKQVAVIVRENLAAGNYNRSFSAGNIPAGFYVLKLTHNGTLTTKKVIKN